MVKLFFEEFQLMAPTNVTDGQTDRRTDGVSERQTTCDRKTAHCTKVYHPVMKTVYENTLETCKVQDAKLSLLADRTP